MGQSVTYIYYPFPKLAKFIKCNGYSPNYPPLFNRFGNFHPWIGLFKSDFLIFFVTLSKGVPF
jgi:hypothetical protein